MLTTVIGRNISSTGALFVRQKQQMGVVVHIVIVVTERADLPEEMQNMRIWLDDKRITPNRFEYHYQSDGTIEIKVNFADEREAATFAERFANRG